MTYDYSALFAVLSTDGYKLDHRRQYVPGTEYVYSNWTARGSRISGVDEVVFVGLQYVLEKYLMEMFEDFFAADIEEVLRDYTAFLDSYLGEHDITVDHFRDLHALGYLPLEFKAVPEGTRVPLRVPMLTVENTLPEFFWLTNYVETLMSSALWMPMTSATIAARLRDLLDSWAMKTAGSTDGVSFQGHDFSMRGMAGMDAAVQSGMGHLVAFTGSDCLPAILATKNYYPTDEWLAGGVPATEHSVMCAGGEDDERGTFKRLMETYPKGLLSVVSDTWDYWSVLTEILPSLQDQIMSREGKLVIRPDSGDPADIICGTFTPEQRRQADQWSARVPAFPEELGSVQILWDLFGGTVNEQGYKVLDPHIGLIYGDSMNYSRIDEICARLEAQGFASTNVVFGIGSYNYQYQTRDTFMFAMKATNVVINGDSIPIQKDPKTDSGMKKSLKGRIGVFDHLTKGIYAEDLLPNWELELMDDTNLLQPVWRDGQFLKRYGFDEVRRNAGY